MLPEGLPTLEKSEMLRTRKEAIGIQPVLTKRQTRPGQHLLRHHRLSAKPVPPWDVDRGNKVRLGSRREVLWNYGDVMVVMDVDKC